MRLSVVLLGLIVLAGCSRRPTVDSDARLNLLADRSCRAITIRKQRFELATKIRLTQDSLFKLTNKNDSSRLKAKLALYAGQKDVLLKSSIRLADTIHKQLDSLIPYNDKTAEKHFTERLHALLVKKGCTDTSE